MPLDIFYPYVIGNNSPISYYHKKISEYLPSDEFQITIFSQSRSEIINSPNVTEVYVGDPDSLMHGTRRLRNYLRDYDIIHTGGRATQHLKRLKFRDMFFDRAKHVHTFHLDVDPTSRRPTKEKRILAKRADRRTAVSLNTCESVNKYFGLSCSVVYNGVNSKEFRPVEERPESYSPPSGPIFLYVGTFEDRKRPRDVLSVAESVPNSNFALRGSGPLTEELITESNGLSNVFMIKNHVQRQELIRLYSSARGFIFPSVKEGCPTVVLEAMAAGTPVIGYDASSMPEIVENQQTGFLVEAGDVEALAERVQEFARDEQKARSFGRRARRVIKRKHDFREIANKFSEIYRSIT